MLQVKINTKPELIKLLQSSSIQSVQARDISTPDDLTEVKKIAMQMMRCNKRITVFLVAS